MRLTSLAAMLLAGAVTGLSAADSPAQPAATAPSAAAPTSQPAEVPQALLDKMEGLLTPAEPLRSETQAVQMLVTNMEALVQLGRKAEAEYPNAANLYEVRLRLLRAWELLVRFRQDPESARQLLATARRLWDSHCPPGAKVRADYYLTRNKVVNQSPSLQESDGLILALLKRYEGTPAAGEGALSAAVLALQNDRAKLLDELVALLKAKYASDPAARHFLALADRYDGLPFHARLSRLDGGELVLPADLLGKVVVVDFWATWCPHCMASLPHMKELHAKYKDQGLLIVGVCMDTSRDVLEKFLQREKIDWVVTFSGKGWSDPTAQDYGVHQTPTIWVVGRDGKVITTKGVEPPTGTREVSLAPLDKVLQEVIKKPAASQPASEPAEARP